MQTSTFTIEEKQKEIGKVIVTEWPDQQGYSARLEDSNRHSCPIAAGVGDSWYAAVLNLTQQKLAQPYAVLIMAEARKHPVH